MAPEKKINCAALLLLKSVLELPGSGLALMAESHSLVLPRRVTSASKSRAMASTMALAWRAARTSARLRFQVSMAMDVIETRTVTMMAVMAIATISSIRVKPRLAGEFRGDFMGLGWDFC